MTSHDGRCAIPCFVPLPAVRASMDKMRGMAKNGGYGFGIRPPLSA